MLGTEKEADREIETDGAIVSLERDHAVLDGWAGSEGEAVLLPAGLELEPGKDGSVVLDCATVLETTKVPDGTGATSGFETTGDDALLLPKSEREAGGGLPEGKLEIGGVETAVEGGMPGGGEWTFPVEEGAGITVDGEALTSEGGIATLLGPEPPQTQNAVSTKGPSRQQSSPPPPQMEDSIQTLFCAHVSTMRSPTALQAQRNDPGLGHGACAATRDRKRSTKSAHISWSALMAIKVGCARTSEQAWSQVEKKRTRGRPGAVNTDGACLIAEREAGGAEEKRLGVLKK